VRERERAKERGEKRVTGCVYVCERDRTGERETGGGGRESGSKNKRGRGSGDVGEGNKTKERGNGGGGRESGSTNKSESESKYYKRMTFFPS